MRLVVLSRAPDDMLTAGSLLVWLDAVVRAYGDDVPLVIRTPEGTSWACLDAHVEKHVQGQRRVVLDARRLVRVQETPQEAE